MTKQTAMNRVWEVEDKDINKPLYCVICKSELSKDDTEDYGDTCYPCVVKEKQDRGEI